MFSENQTNERLFISRPAQPDPAVNSRENPTRSNIFPAWLHSRFSCHFFLLALLKIPWKQRFKVQRFIIIGLVKLKPYDKSLRHKYRPSAPSTALKHPVLPLWKQVWKSMHYFPDMLSSLIFIRLKALKSSRDPGKCRRVRKSDFFILWFNGKETTRVIFKCHRTRSAAPEERWVFKCDGEVRKCDSIHFLRPMWVKKGPIETRKIAPLRQCGWKAVKARPNPMFV